MLPACSLALSSANIPLESPIYAYIEKLAGMGLITSDIKGIRPYSKAEASRLALEASQNLTSREIASPAFAAELVSRLQELMPREFYYKKEITVDPLEDQSSDIIPPESPVYDHINQLKNMGFIPSIINSPQTYTKTSVIQLTQEAAKNIVLMDGQAPASAMILVAKIREQMPRETSMKTGVQPKKLPLIDCNPVASIQKRYVYLNGIPRDFNRPVYIRGGQSAFGFIGGALRTDKDSGVLYESGTEGTPLLENNNGIVYRRGHNSEIRWAAEGYISDTASALVEPMMQYSPSETRFQVNRGYVKLGGGGLELEVGRDENWFGPGHRGALSLSSNAKNFDQIKLSSPEPLDVPWVKNWLGGVKYALIVSRFDETDAGTPDYRRPYFIGFKLAVKPYSWFEYGINFVRQQAGPGFTGSTSIKDEIFGGGYTNHNNSIAGIDLRFRIPWLRNTEVYGEYVGEDSALFWPIVESYIAGVYVPCLTSSCRDDLRFEFFWGNPMLYTDFKFPRGYVYHGMSPGHSQGGSAQDFFVRYSHSFSARNKAALEYFHTDRGQEGRVRVSGTGQYDPLNGVMQAMEHKDAGRISWSLPIYGDVDGKMLYGIEKISNLNLMEGEKRTNQLFSIELRYRY
jgi:hypothetical protein